MAAEATFLFHVDKFGLSPQCAVWSSVHGEICADVDASHCWLAGPVRVCDLPIRGLHAQQHDLLHTFDRMVSDVYSVAVCDNG